VIPADGNNGSHAKHSYESLPELLYQENNSLSPLGRCVCMLRRERIRGKEDKQKGESQCPLTFPPEADPPTAEVLSPKGRGYCPDGQASAWNQRMGIKNGCRIQL